MYRKGMDLLAGILPIMCANYSDVQFIIGKFSIINYFLFYQARHASPPPLPSLKMSQKSRLSEMLFPSLINELLMKFYSKFYCKKEDYQEMKTKVLFSLLQNIKGKAKSWLW